MEEVTLSQMLEARERRVLAQQQLSERFRTPVLCFTMNIPGPIKDSPLIRRAFFYGCDALEHRLPKGSVLDVQRLQAVTGCQALYAVDLDPIRLKAIATAIEDSIPMGRLFDMDVLDSQGRKLERSLVGGKPRNCIVCGQEGRGCASRRVHSISQLQEASNGLMSRHFARLDAQRIGAMAVRSLLEEVCISPKPGLVDRNNNGSHDDMDLFTFLSSAAALSPYFVRCVRLGQDTGTQPPEQTFQALRAAGLWAEQEMFAATGGVNTHKGAIFSLGILCGAAGRLWTPQCHWEESSLFREAARMTALPMEQDWLSALPDTPGQRLYRELGVRGIRGEAAAGFPSVEKLGLPYYRRSLREGMEPNLAGAYTLLALIAQVEDTNLLHRGGVPLAKSAAHRAQELLEQPPSPEALQALDEWFTRHHLSPGGCADLLAAVLFTHHLLDEYPATP